MNEIEEAPEWNPPSPERVARRALVLSAVVCRSGIEGDSKDPNAEAFRRTVLDWLEKLELLSELEPNEAEFLKKPLGLLDRRQVMDASWRTEGLAVLTWALGRYDLPAYDSQADGPIAGYALGFLSDSKETVLERPQLRSLKEMELLSESLFSAHWRLKQFSLDQKPMDFQEFARTAWFGPLSLERLRLRERDLEIKDKALSAATEQAWREVMSIVQERHQAILWLQGQDELYSRVSTDT